MDELDKAVSAAIEQHTEQPQEVSQESEAAPEAPSSEPVESGKPKAETAQPSAEVEQPIEAPQHWEADKREAFKTLPRAQQEFVLERMKAIEADYTRKTQEVAKQRETVEPLLTTAKQFEPYFKQLGVSAEQAFATLVNTERLLRTGSPAQKATAFAQLASDYGIDLRSLGAAPQTGEAANPTMPNLNPVLSEVAELRTQLSQLQQSQMTDYVSSFASTKGPDGQPLYPHFDKVRETMGQLMQANGETDLASLYEKACYLVPEVREAIINSKLEAERKAQTENARKAAAEARKATAVNLKAADPVQKPVSQNLDDIISEAIAAN